jgi:SpoVK/Ycf46/Vps4 family AAA+-type ATPase
MHNEANDDALFYVHLPTSDKMHRILQHHLTHLFHTNLTFMCLRVTDRDFCATEIAEQGDQAPYSLAFLRAIYRPLGFDDTYT